jgi:beta-N-acetylhexosaminidase
MRIVLERNQIPLLPAPFVNLQRTSRAALGLAEVDGGVERQQTLSGSSPTSSTRVRAGWPRRALLALLATTVLLLAACGGGPVTRVDQLQLGADLSSSTLAQMEHQRNAQDSAEAFARQQLVLRGAANWYLARMPLDEQLGQMLLDESDGTVYSADMATMVEQQQVGGWILFGDNLTGTFDQTKALFATVQAHAKIPLFIATDQEGGGITRVGQFFGSFPSPRELGDSGDLQYTAYWGQRTAQDLQQLGINTNFAPVVDVSVNGGEPWSYTRTFSDDSHVVATYAGAFMQGEHSAGEIVALKHFPGLGSTTLDPHLTLPVVTRTWDQLQQTELYPYAVLVSQHPDMVMATDVVMPAVDPVYPAELSSKWIDGVLRHQMGYDGVVITDALWMKGIADTWSLGQAAVLAVQAGSDIMIAAYSAASNQTVLDALNAAVASGQITRARIAESVQRILMVKIKYGLLPIPPSILAAQPLTNP